MLYGVAPVVFAVVVRRLRYRRAMFPILWLIALGCLAVMLSDPGFDRAVLWRLPLAHPYVGRTALRFVVLASLLAVTVRFVAPSSFAWLPRREPRLFALLAIGYPLVSCLPQGIIWRVFLMYRYSALFADRATVIVFAALAFGLAHVTFRNVVAVVLTALGGALFADTYLTTGSMWLATLGTRRIRGHGVRARPRQIPVSRHPPGERRSESQRRVIRPPIGAENGCGSAFTYPASAFTSTGPGARCVPPASTVKLSPPPSM